MSETYIQDLVAERIGGSQYGKSQAIYKFEKIKRAKRAAMAAHPNLELIDMGVGEPDEMAFPQSVRALSEEAAKPEPRRSTLRALGPASGPSSRGSVRLGPPTRR